MKHVGLCFRCEQRALVMEGNHGPRCECNDKDCSVVSCYMFRPVKPVVTKKARGYRGRPRLTSPLISAREQGVEVCQEMEVMVEDMGKGKLCLYWAPRWVISRIGK